MRHTPATARGTKTGRDIRRLDQGKQPQGRETMVGGCKTLVLLETFKVRSSSVAITNGLKEDFQCREWKEWLWIWKRKTKSINAEPSSWNMKSRKSHGDCSLYCGEQKVGTKVGGQMQVSQLHAAISRWPQCHREQKWGRTSKVSEVSAVVNAFTWLPKSSNKKMHMITSSFTLALRWLYWGRYRILQHGRFIWNEAASL